MLSARSQSSPLTKREGPSLATAGHGADRAATRPDFVLERLEDRLLLSSNLAAGPEFLVKASPEGLHGNPFVGMGADGDFVIGWESRHTGDVDIYAQRFDALGTPQGGEFRVNTTTDGHQRGGAIEMCNDGGFVVFWGGSSGTFAQWFDAGGAAQGGEVLITTNRYNSVAMDADGDFVLVWGGDDCFAQLFDASGVPLGDEFQVDTTVADAYEPAVAMDDDGDFVVAWTSTTSSYYVYGYPGAPTEEDIFARRYNEAGVPQSAEFQVSTNTATSAPHRWSPAVAMDADGDFVVAWQGQFYDQVSYDYTSPDIVARRYDSAGVAQGDEFGVDSTGDWGGEIQGPAVAMDADGDFVVAYEGYYMVYDLWDVGAKRYNIAGEELPDGFCTSSTVYLHQEDPTVAMDADGDFVLVWEGYGYADGDVGEWGIWARRFGAPAGADDNDGVPGQIEDGAPNGGDGNSDGIADSEQSNVASLPNAVDGTYVTLASPVETSFTEVTAVENPSPGDAPDGVDFPVGFFEYRLAVPIAGASTTVTQHLSGGQTVNTYYKYGPTPADPTDHWYEFLFDGTTGAEIFPEQDQVVLHFVDGMRGDDDLAADGVVVEPGAPGLRVNTAPVAADDVASTHEDTAVNIDVLANDTDPENDSLWITILGSTNGTAVVNDGDTPTDPTDDTVDFTPAGNFHGAASITYAVNDGQLDSNEATVTVTVWPVADVPLLAVEDAVGYEDEAIDLSITADLADTDGSESLSVRMDGVPEGALLSAGADQGGGTWLLAPEDVPGLTIMPPENSDDDFVLTVTATATESNNGDAASVSADLNVTVRNLVDLSGRVFEDRDNDGLFDPDDGDLPLDGVIVCLLDQIAGTPIAQATTDEDGTYAFDVNLRSGTYKIVAEQPAGYLDGKEMPGTIGGTVDNSQDWQEIRDIHVPEGAETPDGTGYDFAELLPALLQGLVWEDFNDDAEVDLGELAIEGVAITLTGTDDRGNEVVKEQLTNDQGIFEFVDLRPGTYAITETQPEGLVDGQESLGEVVEVKPPTPPVILGADGYIDPVGDRFAGIDLVAGSSGINYNLGERIDGGQVHTGQTATIGFWQNKNGQALIKSLNGSAQSTLLGDWLAETFPNMYGFLAGKTNEEIAATYQQLFKRNAKTSPGGPPKLDAQVMAVALATFVTKESLVSLWYGPPDPDVDLIAQVESYGFAVTAGGVGSAFFNIGASGAAFDGYDDYEDVQVIDLLRATDRMSLAGLLYDDADGDGTGDGLIDSFEAMLRTLANEVYTAINEAGEI